MPCRRAGFYCAAQFMNKPLFPLLNKTTVLEIMMKNNSSLMESLGYVFSDPSLLELALRHPSVGAVNNQRLEFLGDAVLQLAVSNKLYASFPQAHEGQLTSMRQALVCEEALADIARKLNIGDYLQMDHGCRNSGISNQNGALSDAMESILAAVYLDGGYEAAASLVLRLWPVDEHFSENAKSRLQELLQAEKKPVPEYLLVSDSGPAHARTFTSAVFVDGTEIGRGSGTSKKRAEQAAAEAALKNISRGDRA